MSSYAPFEELDRMFAEMDRRLAEMRRSFRASAGPIEEPMTPAGSMAPAGANEESMAVESMDRPAGAMERRAGDGRLTLDREDGEVVLVADLPGFETEELTLTVEDGVLRIHAERDVEEDRYTRRSRVHERVTLPKGVLAEEITAAYRNGVLEVHVPVDESARDGRTIEISD